MGRRDRQSKFGGGCEVALTDDIESKVRSGMLAAAQSMPICAPAIRALNPVVSKLVPTMGVDKYYRVYVNPEFVEEIMEMARNVSSANPCTVCGATSHHEIAYVGGVICHEAWHPMREHQDRARSQGLVTGLQFYVWNIATDMEINDDLLQIFKQCDKPRLCLPPVQVSKDMKSRAPGVLIPSTFNMDGGKLAEEYYHNLYEEAKKQQESAASQGGDGDSGDDSQQGDGDGDSQGDGSGKQTGSGGVPNSGPFGDIYNCGSGADGQSRPYEAGPPGDGEPVPGISEAEGHMVRKAVAKNIQEASRSRGTMPGGWKRWADAELAPPKYDWRKEMNKVIRFALSRVPGDRLRTFRRLGRRSASLMRGGRMTAVLPSAYNPKPRVVIVQDTSGSMSENAIKMSMSEAEAILRAAGASVGFLACDAAADTVQEVHGSMRNVAVHGGGGTDMRIGIRAALEAKPSPDIVVLFTDGYTPWPDQPLPQGKQLVVGLVGEHACDINEVPHWAHAIRITGDDVIVRPKAA